MRRRDQLEHDFEAALAGRAHGAVFSRLIGALRDEAITDLAPVPASTLSRVMIDGFEAAELDTSAPSRSLPEPPPARSPWRKNVPVPSLLTSRRAQAGAGAVALAIGLTGVAAAGALPDPVQDRVADAVSTVTPFNLPDSASDTARDATGESDGVKGVDGRSIAEQRKAAAEERKAAAEERKAGAEERKAENHGAEPEGAPASQSQLGHDTADDAEDGGVDGPETSQQARDTHQPPVEPGAGGAEHPTPPAP